MDYLGRIMLLDDEPEILEVILSTLEADYKGRVDNYSNPHEAYFAFDKEDYFLVIMDFKMPGMNGLEFCQEIVKKNSNVKFILVSGCLDPAIEDQAKRVGVEYCLSKPIDTFELLKKVKEILKYRIAEYDAEMELRIGFLEEMSENFLEVEQIIISTEKNKDNMENIDKLFRLFHNLKGGGAAVGFKKISEFAHGIENKLNMLREGKIKITNDIINSLLASIDVIKSAITVLKEEPCCEPDISFDLESKKIFVEINIDKDLVLSNINEITKQLNFNEATEYKVNLNIENIDTAGVQYLLSLYKLPNRFITFKCNNQNVLNNLKILGLERLLQ